MRDKYINTIFICIFAVILALPIIFTNRKKNIVSEDENRELALFPDIFDNEGNLNENLSGKYENWIGDNIGFREYFVKNRARTMLLGFGISPTESVHIGKNGWYFSNAYGNTLEIVTGQYRLTEEQIKYIADKQQEVSDWYKSRGITYILSIIPHNSTIYTEYLNGGNFSVCDTLADDVVNYILQNTDVIIVYPKQALLDVKNDNKVCLQYDSHFTQYGYYIVYKEFVNKLNELGIIDSPPIDAKFVETIRDEGDLSKLIGYNILGGETAIILDWDRNTSASGSGDTVDAAKKYFASDTRFNKNNRANTALFTNKNNKDGLSGLIYGDSHWQNSRRCSTLLSESFSKLLYCDLRTGGRYLSKQVEDLIEPDIVIYSCIDVLIERHLYNNAENLLPQ